MKQLQEILKPYFAEWQIEADITAVLKCINTFWKSNMIRIPWDEQQDIQNSSFPCCYVEYNSQDYFAVTSQTKSGFGRRLQRIENFPNKPLHLYTQQENRDLLELLNKIWTKK